MQFLTDSSGGELPFLPWSAIDRLTISFAPDGTQISKYSSNLYSTFASLLSANQIEAQILKAFQTWARQTGANIGYRTEDGSVPFGAQSMTQADSRVGDVRVGAIPMASDVYAVAIRHDATTSGGWAGDILFNTNAAFANPTQFFSVALHEAGHVFGLEHNSDPTSVMNPNAFRSVLNSNDIAAIRALYGTRALDLNDAEESNQLFDDATRIENPGSLNGTVPLILYGDLQPGDVDYYRLTPLSGYDQSITFRLYSKGISLLRSRISLYSENGLLIATQAGGGIRGSDLSVTVPTAAEGEDYYLRVEPVDGSLYSTGSYAVVATFDANLTASLAEIQDVALADYALLRQSDVRKRFLFPETHFFNQELLLNDTFALAEGPKSAVGFQPDLLYQVNASFSYFNDLDYYRFTAPQNLPPAGTMTLVLDMMEPGRLVPSLQVFDSQQQLQTAQVLVNGNGQLILQVPNALANEEYYVQAAADRVGDSFDFGNYSLTARFDRPAAELTHFAGNTVSSAHRGRLHTLYIAETQMFHFALTAAAAYSRSDAQLWMTIYDPAGNVLYRCLTNPGQTRTTQSLILRPGSYLVHVQLAVRAGAILPATPLNYTLDGLRIDDPMGPEIIPPNERPFQKESPTSPNYVYPRNRLSPSTYLMVDGREINPPPGSVTPNPYVDANAWYWTPDYLAPPGP